MGVPVSRARVAGAVSSDSRVTNVTCYKLEICFLNLLIQTENKNTSGFEFRIWLLKEKYFLKPSLEFVPILVLMILYILIYVNVLICLSSSSLHYHLLVSHWLVLIT